MKSWAKWVVLTIALAAVFHFLTVFLYPRVIMTVAIQRILNRAGSAGTPWCMLHG